MKLKIVPYKRFSDSAFALRDALRSIEVPCQIVHRDSPTYWMKSSHQILNWGTNIKPTWGRNWGVINDYDYVNQATNKLISFQVFRANNILTPPWTTNRDEAYQWIRDGFSIVCRTVLNGTNGHGIVLADTIEQMVDAPLFVQYKKKKKEFRIHVFNGKVIDVQQKRKRHDADVNAKIRNLTNGWVFCREDVICPEGADDLAQRAVSSLGLQFGAVDIIYNEKEKSSYVLEVNTAPGLEGTTLQSYALAIKEWFNEIKS